MTKFNPIPDLIDAIMRVRNEPVNDDPQYRFAVDKILKIARTMFGSEGLIDLMHETERIYATEYKYKADFEYLKALAMCLEKIYKTIYPALGYSDQELIDKTFPEMNAQ